MVTQSNDEPKKKGISIKDLKKKAAVASALTAAIAGGAAALLAGDEDVAPSDPLTDVDEPTTEPVDERQEDATDAEVAQVTANEVKAPTHIAENSHDHPSTDGGDGGDDGAEDIPVDLDFLNRFGDKNDEHPEDERSEDTDQDVAEHPEDERSEDTDQDVAEHPEDERSEDTDQDVAEHPEDERSEDTDQDVAEHHEDERSEGVDESADSDEYITENVEDMLKMEELDLGFSTDDLHNLPPAQQTLFPIAQLRPVEITVVDFDGTPVDMAITTDADGNVFYLADMDGNGTFETIFDENMAPVASINAPEIGDLYAISKVQEIIDHNHSILNGFDDRFLASNELVITIDDDDPYPASTFTNDDDSDDVNEIEVSDEELDASDEPTVEHEMDGDTFIDNILGGGIFGHDVPEGGEDDPVTDEPQEDLADEEPQDYFSEDPDEVDDVIVDEPIE